LHCPFGSFEDGFRVGAADALDARAATVAIAEGEQR
jgi:hypothetical protein